jgi:hypothetical protein
MGEVSAASSVEIPVRMESIDPLRPFLLEQSDDRRIGYGLSIAGHIIVMLLLVVGLFERIEVVAGVEVPVEIVMEKPEEAPPASVGAGHIPAVADVDKHAKAPPAAVNVNGIDQPKQPGLDGRDPSADHANVALPTGPDGETDAASGASNPSRAMVAAPIGAALPQMTAREPGEDDLTAIKEQKVECGVMAKHPTPAIVTQGQARVRGFATEAQALAMIRANQVQLDRHINSGYIGNRRLFVESLDARRRFVVLLPSGLTVNVGDVIEYDQHHLDPSDSCQYIPNLAVRKL